MNGALFWSCRKKSYLKKSLLKNRHLFADYAMISAMRRNERKAGQQAVIRGGGDAERKHATTRVSEADHVAERDWFQTAEWDQSVDGKRMCLSGFDVN